MATATRAGLKNILARRLRIFSYAIVSITMIAGSAFAAEHVRHYLNRAADNERSVLAEILAQPICSGATTDKIKPAQLSFADYEKLKRQ
ncbi:hypothetical protein [Phyllobacterium sp. K27]